MIKYIEHGNIFNLQGVTSYAHGCNCAGAMGKGIALQFKEKFPQMYLEYKKLCKEGKYSLGDTFVFDYGNGVVFNLGTQATWKTKANIDAIESSLNKMLVFATKNNLKAIALPKIGAGLGGLNWQDVKSTLNKVSNNFPDIELIVVENYKAD